MQGLTVNEAQRRLAEQGPNELDQGPGTSWLSLLLGQFKSPMVLLLLGACVVSGALGELVDAIAIGAIVVLNAVVGFFQEFRAERAVQALRSMTAPRARVRRDGTLHTVPARDVVVGDVLVLEAGDVVAADARIAKAHRLATNEAALTGESAQVEKSATPTLPDAPLAERADHVFMGTAVAAGTATAEVIATGMRTQLGRIAELLERTSHTVTPLQERLSKVSRMLLVSCLGIVIVVAAAGLLRGRGWFDVFFTAVSLAVAAVPEGLPAIVTIALSIGVQRMAKRHLLVRRLPAVETLGCATVICTDKTGTLTTGVMTLRELWGDDELALLDAAAACCDAEVGVNGKPGVGDTTELAILHAAAARGLHRTDIEKERPRISEHPFEAERKRMSVYRADRRLYVKGAIETVAPLCHEAPQRALAVAADMARRGLRVLAVAVGEGPDEANLRLRGLLGIADPPRPEVVEAIAQAAAAGIRTVMITGDHPLTAAAIAAELGLVRDGVGLDDAVHARATPERKLEVVRALKAQGHVVAMTGDGVNDAPALREAHIGVCMGLTGTEVTREASDVVLADDNFASIVAAIREGRGIFDNIRKALVYLLAGNAGELMVMFFAAIAGWPVPLLPLHLLWINLVTDGLPALSLVMDPPEADVMRRPPRSPTEPMLRWREWRKVLLLGSLEAAVTLAVFAWAHAHRNEAEARSLAFAVNVAAQVLSVVASRSTTRVFWLTGVFSNLTLLTVVAASLGAQVALYALPPLRVLFDLVPLHPDDWLLVLAVGLIPVSAVELLKLARSAWHRSTSP